MPVKSSPRNYHTYADSRQQQVEYLGNSFNAACPKAGKQAGSLKITRR